MPGRARETPQRRLVERADACAAPDLCREAIPAEKKAVEECPPGAVMVIDSRKDARAASAGGILVSRLMKRDASGPGTR